MGNPDTSTNPSIGTAPAFPVRLAVFVGIYMLGFGSLAVREGNTEFIIYAGSMIVFIAIVLAMRSRVAFRSSTLWLLAIWGCLHMAGGTVPIPAELAHTDSEYTVLYSLRPWADLPRYDQIIHGFGFFAATLACYDAVCAAAGRATVRPSLAIAAALMGMGLGAINEVLEFATTLVADTNVGGYVNTGWDLVSNTIGACTAAALCIFVPGRSAART